VEVFRIASVQAAELVEDVPVIETVPAPPEDLGSASKPRLTRMVSKWIEAKGPAEAFGPKELCRELNQLYGKKLRRQLDQRQVSDVLRRFERLGRLHRLQSGRPYGQTLYCRRNPGTAAVSPACT
jgi:hypothetical protein